MNEEADIRDVKDLIEIPEPPNYLLWALITVVAIVLAIFLWKWLTKNKSTPGVSAANRALKELNKAERLLNKNSPGPLVVSVSEIVRNYIENRFALDAPRQTTEQFLHNLYDSQNIDLKPCRDELGDFLRSCDSIKFGQAGLEKQGRKQLLKSARHIIESTADVTAQKTERELEK